MSRKSRRNRVRQPVRDGVQAQTGNTSPQPPVAVEPPAAAVLQTAPSVRPSAKAVAAVAQHAHVVAELRRIGILAGIMLVILIVLAVILS